MAVKAISLKYHLTGEVNEFLENEAMPCPHTQNGLVELINQISTYKEEGKPLFPEVYITDSLKSIQESLVNCEFVMIGKAPKSGLVISTALKKCAPLTMGGWCIFVLRTADDFEFGLFRSGATIVSIPASTSLITDGNKETNLILIRQVSDKIVEVKGVKGHALIINFGIKSTSNLSPLDEQLKLIEKILTNVDENLKDQTRIFLIRLFLYVMQNGHGNLCMVVDHSDTYPDYLRDGIVLQTRISIPEKISALTRASNEDSGLNLLEANSRLNGVFNLIAGMLLSDGITIFTNKACICGYNIFLKHPENDDHLKQVEGGARSRTFYVMRQKLSKNVTSVYIQSQDGKTQTESYE